jgi:formyl-CoA transferase
LGYLSSQPKFWDGLLIALSRPDLADDVRFKTRDVRIKNFTELTRVLGEIVAQGPRAEWMRCSEANDVPFAPVHNLPDVIADPQVKHLETFRTLRHPTEGESPRSAGRCGSTATRRLGPARADLGQHTVEVLRESRLRRRGSPGPRRASEDHQIAIRSPRSR